MLASNSLTPEMIVLPTRVFGILASVLAFAVVWSGCSGPTSMQKEPPPKIDSAAQSPGSSLFAGSSQSPGRYQLVTTGNTTTNSFLVDTSTGCVWHLVQNEKTKRPTFIEADVENLHWGWGSGAQQILAAQIESLSYPEEQKATLKQKLQRTECGQFNVTLSPETSRKSEHVPEAKPPGPEK